MMSTYIEVRCHDYHARYCIGYVFNCSANKRSHLLPRGHVVAGIAVAADQRLEARTVALGPAVAATVLMSEPRQAPQ